MNLKLIVPIMLVLFSLLAATYPVKYIEIDSCQDVKISPGSYYIFALKQDLTFSGVCFTVENYRGIGVEFDCKGHRLSDGFMAFDISNSTNVIIKNCRIDNVDTGIYLDRSENSLLVGNTIYNSENAVHLYKSSYNTISKNILHNNTNYGIFLVELSTNNLIKENIVYGNGGHGIFADAQCYHTIVDRNNVTFNNGYGVGFGHSSNGNITSNTLIGNLFGIILSHNVNSCYVASNHIQSSYYDGVLFDYPQNSNNVIYNNTILYSNRSGILFKDPSNENNTIIDNRIVSSNGDGISIAGVGVNSHIINNFISSNNGWGVNIRSVGMHSIHANNITSNAYGGVHISYATVELADNILENNHNYQLYIESSNNNLIYNNIFNASAGQGVVYDEGSNYWNSSYDCSQTNIIGGNCIGGNFYSNYTGYDNNGDGIGEDEYYIYGGSNIDHLPLTNQHGKITIKSIRWVDKPRIKINKKMAGHLPHSIIVNPYTENIVSHPTSTSLR